MLRKVIAWGTALLTALVGVTAGAGLFVAGTYSRETVSWATQGIGQDAADLAIALPSLIVSAVFAMRGSLRAVLIWLGVVLYLVYSYVLYSFFVHFSPLFPAYVATLGVSFYSFVFALNAIDGGKVMEAVSPRAPVRLVSGILFTLAALFFVAWAAQIAPAVIHGVTPSSVVEVGLPVNPVHVLDMGLLLPGMAITALLLWRKRPVGYLLAAPLLAFSAIMGAAIVCMMVAMRAEGLTSSLAPAVFIGAVSMVSLACLWLLLRGMDRSKAVLPISS